VGVPEGFAADRNCPVVAHLDLCDASIQYPDMVTGTPKLAVKMKKRCHHWVALHIEFWSSQSDARTLKRRVFIPQDSHTSQQTFPVDMTQEGQLETISQIIKQPER
jgi:hypothetical protein